MTLCTVKTASVAFMFNICHVNATSLISKNLYYIHPTNKITMEHVLKGVKDCFKRW